MHTEFTVNIIKFWTYIQHENFLLLLADLTFDFLPQNDSKRIVLYVCPNGNEPPHGKANNLHRKKQRPRSASQQQQS